MKKGILTAVFISSLFCFNLFAQDNNSDELNEAVPDMMETDAFSDSEAESDATPSDFESGLEDFDDFDSIFNDAEDFDEPLTDEPSQENGIIQVVSSAFSSMVHFSGSFSGQVGVVYNYNGMAETEDDKNTYNFGIKLNNSLGMTVTPGGNLIVRGGVDTGIDNGFSLGVSYFYFDYLLFNRIFISAGKKGIGWGYLRLLGGGHNNIFAEDGTMLAMEVRYPWTFGTLTFAVTGNASSIRPNTLNYYGSLEVTVLNTSINLYAKRPEKASVPKKSNAFGLELKRTVLGFDVYGQGLLRIVDMKGMDTPKNYEYITGTFGFYRLFDSFDPHIGFNIEYKHEYEPKAEHVHSDCIAFQGGLSRIGKNKNIKIGLTSNFDITQKTGSSGIGLSVSGLLPYADWANGFNISYGKTYTAPVFSISTGISIALDY